MLKTIRLEEWSAVDPKRADRAVFLDENDRELHSEDIHNEIQLYELIRQVGGYHGLDYKLDVIRDCEPDKPDKEQRLVERSVWDPSKMKWKVVTDG